MQIIFNSEFIIQTDMSVEEFQAKTLSNYKNLYPRYIENRSTLAEMLHLSEANKIKAITFFIHMSLRERSVHWSPQDESIHLFSGLFLKCNIQYKPGEMITFDINDSCQIHTPIDHLDSFLNSAYQEFIVSKDPLADLAGLFLWDSKRSVDLDSEDLVRFKKIIGFVLASDKSNMALSQRMPSRIVPIQIKFDSFGYSATSISIPPLYENGDKQECLSPYMH